VACYRRRWASFGKTGNARCAADHGQGKAYLHAIVIIINAGKILLTGKKLSEKKYHHHTGFPGGLRTIAAGDLLAKNPEKVVREAVFGMLPKSKLGQAMRKKLKVYAGPQHPHQAQQPTPLAL